jgi:opacity protein-like surface antigen
MKHFLLIAVAAALLAGCARTADVVPLDDAATAAGIPKIDMTLYGTGYGPVTVTMPDGEVLTGHYQLSLSGMVSSGSATATGSSGSATVSGSAIAMPTTGSFVLQAVGNHGTSISCRGEAGGLGHGSTVCVTNHGAHYQLIF